jgi:hypothetical protein
VIGAMIKYNSIITAVSDQYTASFSRETYDKTYARIHPSAKGKFIPASI